MAAVKKTPEEVLDLKMNWLRDPCWDIEDTEGFEDYQAELIAYRLEKEEYWANERLSGQKRKAEELGVPGNIKLAQYILTLEYTNNLLQAKVDGLITRSYELQARIDKLTKAIRGCPL